MYLNYLQIVNYKNLKSTKFHFDKGVNTIIGENDSGKSNAMTALRILLDDSYYYNKKRLKESDFFDSLDNWKGHWIIISAVFGEITSEDKKTEVCAEIIPDKENENFLKSYVKCCDKNIGVITLYIRPQKQIRSKLSRITDINEFMKERNNIKLSDYEFYYTSRSQTDFLDKKVYIDIVGDLDNGQCTDPREDDEAILGSKLHISDIQDHISVIFIDALRDVQSELHKSRNPIRRIIESVEATISEYEINQIKNDVINLNYTLSNVEQVESVADNINQKLLDMIGMVYSPEIILDSGLKDDVNSLSRYLVMKPSKQDDINLLGLGHLNMIYIALKLVEYEFNRTRELINIMIIEEPEAHIHTHIQKTLFNNLKVSKNYTQIITTTHSTHLSEVSEIKRINIMKSVDNVSYAMRPNNGLNEFGIENLNLKSLNLSSCIERYLDEKRTVLLFSKGILLVEGDGEEILIPNMVYNALGLSLDELGVGIVNIGSTAFEYIACLFDDKRIQRYCAIITDLDKQLVDSNSSFYSIKAEEQGNNRKEKLDDLFKNNSWVKSFYATNTLELEFVKNKENKKYIIEILNLTYKQDSAIKKHEKRLYGSDAECANTILTLANKLGKGWYATLLSQKVNYLVNIPEYILEAITFACQESITIEIIIKMIEYSLKHYKEDEETNRLVDRLKIAKKKEEKERFIEEYMKCLPQDIVTLFINQIMKYKQ